MLRTSTTHLDPLAHRAAIDALEAQRAAYRRYARAMEAQQRTLTDGDGDRASAVAETASRGFDELQTGARRLQPLLERASEAGTPEQLVEMRRQMEELMREARSAEAAIQNMSVQLEAWRDAYGRQLAELGIVPGGSEAERTPEGAAGAAEARASGGYGRTGAQARRTAGTVPSLIDRRG
jgi:hypothetical protein